MRSLERFAAEQGTDRGDIGTAPLDLVDHDAEAALLQHIDRLGEEIECSAIRRAPHRLAAYGCALAGAVHKFYTDVRIIGAEDGAPISAELTVARLWLVEAAKSTLVSVLGILGISAPDEM